MMTDIETKAHNLTTFLLPKLIESGKTEVDFKESVGDVIRVLINEYNTLYNTILEEIKK